MDETGQAYVYTGDDPVNGTDPMGLASIAGDGWVVYVLFFSGEPYYVGRTSRWSYDDTTNEVDINDRLGEHNGGRYELGNTSFQYEMLYFNGTEEQARIVEQTAIEAADTVWSCPVTPVANQREEVARGSEAYRSGEQWLNDYLQQNPLLAHQLSPLFYLQRGLEYGGVPTDVGQQN